MIVILLVYLYIFESSLTLSTLVCLFWVTLLKGTVTEPGKGFWFFVKMEKHVFNWFKSACTLRYRHWLMCGGEHIHTQSTDSRILTRTDAWDRNLNWLKVFYLTNMSSSIFGNRRRGGANSQRGLNPVTRKMEESFHRRKEKVLASDISIGRQLIRLPWKLRLQLSRRPDGINLVTEQIRSNVEAKRADFFFLQRRQKNVSANFSAIVESN